MVYDYAKRPPSATPRWKKYVALIFLFVIAAFLLTSILYYVDARKTAAPIKKVAADMKPIQLPKHQKSTKPLHTAPSTQFDFYTLLPKMEVSVPSINLPMTPEPTKNHYILQVASLQNSKDANQLKLHLIALGFMASVQSYRNNDGSLWSRVLVGPFNSDADAQKAQEALDQHRIDSLQLMVK